MVALWRLGLAALCAVVVYFTTRSATELLLVAVRRRIGKRFRWVGDIHRYLLSYISWTTVLLLFLVIAHNVLELETDSDAMQIITYITAIPVVLGTFALRIVVTNMIVRHFKWDRSSHEYDAKIFVVTETIKFLCFILIMVEIFYFFFPSNEVAGFLLVEVFAVLEAILILSGFTVLKNIATGMFLVFAEPFRAGSFCGILDFQGFVERVSLARTILRKHDGALVYIPNGIFADWRQTNNSTADPFRHELLLRFDASISIETLKSIRDDMQHTLGDFSSVFTEDSSPSVASLSSFTASSFVDSGVRHSRSATSEALPIHKALYVGLSDMYHLKVKMVIDRGLFPSAEAAKTEMNIVILQVLEQHRATALTLR